MDSAELLKSLMYLVPWAWEGSLKFDVPVKVVHISCVREDGRVKPKRGLISMNREEIWV